MKPFDLERAKLGHPIATIMGQAATFIAHIPYADIKHRVIVMVGGNMIPESFTENGNGIINILVMKPMVKYANLYKIDDKHILGSTALYDSKEIARSYLDPDTPNEKYLRTIEIQVEE